MIPLELHPIECSFLRTASTAVQHQDRPDVTQFELRVPFIESIEAITNCILILIEIEDVIHDLVRSYGEENNRDKFGQRFLHFRYETRSRLLLPELF